MVCPGGEGQAQVSACLSVCALRGANGSESVRPQAVAGTPQAKTNHSVLPARGRAQANSRAISPHAAPKITPADGFLISAQPLWSSGSRCIVKIQAYRFC